MHICFYTYISICVYIYIYERERKGRTNEGRKEMREKDCTWPTLN